MAASALYACTKCTQRYPFEELSQESAPPALVWEAPLPAVSSRLRPG